MVNSATTAATTITSTTAITDTTTHGGVPTESDPSLELRLQGALSLSSKPTVLKLFKTTSELKVVLLESESVSQIVIEAFEEAGYQVETFTQALTPSDDHHHKTTTTDLLSAIRTAHILGVGPKSCLTAQVLDYASNLLAVGCFGTSTVPIDLQAAATRGVPVFCSSFNHARSVAELVIGNIIALARQLGDRNLEMHNGVWQKVSRGCFEIRGKVLGIVGYGRVGTQVSMLAEVLGLRVYFYDVVTNTMPLGRAQQVDSLEALLQMSDFVSLHASSPVRIGSQELMQMKRGAYLINTMASDTNAAIHIPALVDALRSGHLAGAALDVDPQQQQRKKKNKVDAALLGCSNVILTPHVGCSTKEANEAIGKDVSASMIKYIAQGLLDGGMKLPEHVSRDVPGAEEQDDTKDKAKSVRALHIRQQGVPGILKVRS